jgi:hypothetical protein
VRRRLSPPHIVVIERRQIIMNQRIGVNQLDRAGKRHQPIFWDTKQLTRSKGEDRPNAFAAGKNSITHRPKKRLCSCGIFMEMSVEGTINDSGLPVQVIVQRKIA